MMVCGCWWGQWWNCLVTGAWVIKSLQSFCPYVMRQALIDWLCGHIIGHEYKTIVIYYNIHAYQNGVVCTHIYMYAREIG